MITILFASIALGPGALTCPMTGESITKSFADIDYNGVRYSMCCGGCPDAFKKDPATALKNEKLKDKTVGVSLFDPVSAVRVVEKDAKGGSEDFNGVRYYFQNAEDKTAFDAEPKKFTATPKKELLYCAVMGHPIKDYATAGGYVDVAETRYYVCCPDCLAALKKDPQSIIAKVQDKVKAPLAMDAPKKS
jgi:YHS domain-containing protein